jgi:hydroxymethylbilane synthase
MLPQVGQGALAVECRADDPATTELLAAIDDRARRRVLEAERAFLARLGGGCSMPCGALASEDGGEIVIDAMLASGDGRVLIRARGRHRDPTTAGRAVADELLARGGSELLDVAGRDAP